MADVVAYGAKPVRDAPTFFDVFNQSFDAARERRRAADLQAQRLSDIEAAMTAPEFEKALAGATPEQRRAFGRLLLSGGEDAVAMVFGDLIKPKEPKLYNTPPGGALIDASGKIVFANPNKPSGGAELLPTIDRTVILPILAKYSRGETLTRREANLLRMWQRVKPQADAFGGTAEAPDVVDPQDIEGYTEPPMEEPVNTGGGIFGRIFGNPGAKAAEAPARVEPAAAPPAAAKPKPAARKKLPMAGRRIDTTRIKVGDEFDHPTVGPVRYIGNGNFEAITP
jgi:hypothetical protein